MLSALFLSSAHAWLGSDGLYNYSESDSGDANAPVQSFTDISTDPSAVILSVSNSDDSAESLAGIATAPVIFYNNTYTPADIFVSSNGVISFEVGGFGYSGYSNNSLPSSSIGVPAIACWSDLNPGSGGDIYVLDDAAILTIQWNAVEWFGGGGATTFQVQMIRATGEVLLTVQDQTGSNDVNIGIQRDSTLGLEVYGGSAPLIGPPLPVTWLFAPDDVDDDGDGYAGVDDCNDNDADVSPDGIEICDGQDNDCNGQTDEAGGAGAVFYVDNDNDGFGDTNDTVESDSCFPPPGLAIQDGDCNDNDITVRPNAQERCDAIDHNCDGDLYADATDLNPYQLDGDGDGWGNPPTQFACEVPTGVATIGPNDCDDTRGDVYPGATEIHFDGVDNNCDGRELDDRDHDGMNDSDEYAYGSDWRHPDSDGDGVLDGAEFAAGADPLNPDTDGDGLSDSFELANGAIDTDGDGNNNVNDADDDGDGWLTQQESTDDFDGDGIPDYLDTDSDNDGIPDSEETPESLLRVDDAPPIPGPSSGNCGCSSASPISSLLLLPLAALGLRRRR